MSEMTDDERFKIFEEAMSTPEGREQLKRAMEQDIPKRLKIEHYEFGKMIIGDKEYTEDLIIVGDKVIPNWRRKEGHLLCVDDLSAIEAKPDFMVIGTGHDGLMKVDQEVIDKYSPRVVPTKIAVDFYNDLEGSCNNIVAAFHLTC